MFCSKDLLAILDFIIIYFWTQNSSVISIFQIEMTEEFWVILKD